MTGLAPAEKRREYLSVCPRFVDFALFSLMTDHIVDPVEPNGHQAKFAIGQIVRHRFFSFRGVIFDVDPIFNNTEEWYQSIPPDKRPRKDQPFYHLLAENDETTYEAYVSEQNLLIDQSGKPCRHPWIDEMFGDRSDDCYGSPTYFTPN